MFSAKIAYTNTNFIKLPNPQLLFIHSLINASLVDYLMAVWLFSHSHIPFSCLTVHTTCFGLCKAIISYIFESCDAYYSLLIEAVTEIK
jgi:hypothetical protein